jgi:hypothetical protein
MSTTEDTANDSTAGQSTRRRVHIVPHPLGPRVLRRCFEQVERGRNVVSSYVHKRTFAIHSGLV